MVDFDLTEVTERIALESAFIDPLLDEISRVVVGQRYMVERLLIGLLADGHVLLEGVPGLAKTLTVSSLARAIGTSLDRKSTRLNSSHVAISYAVFCLKQKYSILACSSYIDLRHVVRDEIALTALTRLLLRLHYYDENCLRYNTFLNYVI